MEGRAARPTNPRRVPQHALMRTRSRVPRVPNREIFCSYVSWFTGQASHDGR